MSLSFPVLPFEALVNHTGASLLALLARRASLLIEDMPIEENHHQLIALAESLGLCVQEPWLPVGEKVALVQVDQISERPAYADTPFAFGLHTDCSEQFEPPQIVLLQCVRPAAEGGESHFLALQDLIPHLCAADLSLLTQPLFHFREHFFPILEPAGDGYQIRYNRLYQEIFKHLGGACPHDALLDRFEALMQARQEKFLLKPGDCWLLLNRCSLHGRGAFSPHSQRILKRIRVRLQVSGVGRV